MSSLEEWIRKYEEKLSYIRLSIVLRRAKQQKAEEARIRIIENMALNRTVQKILNKHGVGAEFRLPYLDYARRLDMVQRKYRFMVDRRREHQIMRYKAEAQGLSSAVLDDIDAAIIYNLAPG